MWRAFAHARKSGQAPADTHHALGLQITPTEFQNTMNELNSVLASAHDPSKSCADNCLAVLTLYTSPWCLGSHYKRVSGL